MSLCVPLSILPTSHNTLDTPFLDYHIHNSVLGVWAASKLWHAASWVPVERSYKKWGKKKTVTIVLRGLPRREASPEFITSAAEWEESRKKILPEFVQRNAAFLLGDRDQRLGVPRVKTESSFIWSALIGLLLALSAQQWWSKVAEKFLEVEVCLLPTPLPHSVPPSLPAPSFPVSSWCPLWGMNVSSVCRQQQGRRRQARQWVCVYKINE